MQNDIEIYIREPVLKRVLGWLKSELGPLEESPVKQSQKGVRVYRASDHQPPIPIVIQTAVEGGPYVGIWLNSPATPWSSDAECARAAWQAFGLPVMCDPGPDYGDQDDFLRIDADGEKVIRLQDGLLGNQ